MAFVRVRGGHFYLCFRDASGARVQLPSKARTKTEAKRLANDLERKAERIRLGLEEERVEMTFLQVAERYIRDVVPNQADPATVTSQIRKHLIPAFGKLSIHRIRPADIQAMLTSKLETLSAATREHLRLRVQTIFKYAQKGLKAFPGENPAKAIPKVKTERRRPRFLPQEHVMRVIMAADEPALMAYAFLTGVRKGEICGQLREDVDLQRRVIKLRHSYGKVTKGNRERLIPIPEQLVPLLERQLEDSALLESKWLFPNLHGNMRKKHWRAADAFRKALVKAGLTEGFRHSCRPPGQGQRLGCKFSEVRKDDAVSSCPECGETLHVQPVPIPFTMKHTRSTWGTWAYQTTGDIRFVQEQLGHVDGAVTAAHYAHALDQHRQSQANRLTYQTDTGQQAIRVRDLPHDTTETDTKQPTPETLALKTSRGNR